MHKLYIPHLMNMTYKIDFLKVQFQINNYYKFKNMQILLKFQNYLDIVFKIYVNKNKVKIPRIIYL